MVCREDARRGALNQSSMRLPGLNVGMINFRGGAARYPKSVTAMIASSIEGPNCTVATSTMAASATAAIEPLQDIRMIITHPRGLDTTHLNRM